MLLRIRSMALSSRCRFCRWTVGYENECFRERVLLATMAYWGYGFCAVASVLGLLKGSEEVAIRYVFPQGI